MFDPILTGLIMNAAPVIMVVVLWVRIEHRITGLENDVKWLKDFMVNNSKGD